MGRPSRRVQSVPLSASNKNFITNYEKAAAGWAV